jgi:DNA-binding Lrp family transcriptional regulator
MSPFLEDARFPEKYAIFVPGKVDCIYCDVAQPEQARILADNADSLLAPSGWVMLAVKAQSIDVTKDPLEVYKQEAKILKGRGFDVKEIVRLEPYDKAHAMIVARRWHIKLASNHKPCKACREIFIFRFRFAKAFKLKNRWINQNTRVGEIKKMPRAYVLFSVNSGSEDRVIKEITAISEVQEAFVSYGVYDLVVKIKTDSMEQLKELISHRLRVIPDVRSTLTLILVEEWLGLFSVFESYSW